MTRLYRAPLVRLYERGDSVGLVSEDGSVWRADGDSAALVRELVDHLREPRTHDELMAHLSALSGQRAEESSAVQDALTALRAAGVVTTGPAGTAPKGALHGRRLLLALCGGFVAAHAPALTELLQRRGAVVRCAATDSALRFFQPLALSALTHHAVATSLWPQHATEPVPHLALASWAEAVVVYPATATTLARIAAGDCSSLVSAIAVAARVPVLLVVAMNEAMLTAPSVQRNLDQLRRDGFFVTRWGTGYEVALSPEARKPSPGAAPPLSAVADLLAAALAHDAQEHSA
ncbi:MAG: hypothetical protein KF718_08840 [Polyangiaceae bacterium]|nr:hypothetical protein [Polyangiaceae bacterium]